MLPIISLISIPVNALTYENKESFKDIRFIPGGSSVTAYPEKFYNYDYWVITVQPYSYSRQEEFYAYLYLIADNSYETFGSVEGTLKFDIGQYPNNNKLYAVSTSPALDYEQSVYCKTTMTFSDPKCTWNIFGDSISFPAENPITGFVFDNYQSDMFPSYQGSSSNFTSQMIIASNVDIYSYDGDLLQYGNYYTLIQYLGDYIDESRIKDYSGHETAPGVVVEPSTGSSSGGTSSGDSQQLETSKGIWGTVKEILNKLAELVTGLITLPFDIAVALREVIVEALESLKNDILDGLKSLFVPSDNLFNDMRDLLETKFKFANQIIEFCFDLNDVVWLDKPPESNVTIYGVTVSFMNWEFYDDYKSIINTITVIVSYYWFFKKLMRRTPETIGGI